MRPAVSSMFVLAAFALFLPGQTAVAADLDRRPHVHVTKAYPGSGRTVRRHRVQRVAYADLDCRTGWWTCRCTGASRSPVWATRCR